MRPARVRSVEVQSALAAAVRFNAALNGFSARTEVEDAWVGMRKEFVESILPGVPDLKAFDAERFVREAATCDFMKCGIERAEFRSIHSGTLWLRRVCRLCLEYHGDRAAGSVLAEVLRDVGFAVVQRSHRQPGYLLGVRCL